MEAQQADGYAAAVLWVHPDNERARSFFASHGRIGDEAERQQEVLDVEVPEAHLSRTFTR